MMAKSYDSEYYLATFWIMKAGFLAFKFEYFAIF